MLAPIELSPLFHGASLCTKHSLGHFSTAMSFACSSPSLISTFITLNPSSVTLHTLFHIIQSLWHQVPARSIECASSRVPSCLRVFLTFLHSNLRHSLDSTPYQAPTLLLPFFEPRSHHGRKDINLTPRELGAITPKQANDNITAPSSVIITKGDVLYDNRPQSWIGTWATMTDTTGKEVVQLVADSWCGMCPSRLGIGRNGPKATVRSPCSCLTRKAEQPDGQKDCYKGEKEE